MVNICANIVRLKPYQGGKPIIEVQKELGLDHIVKLASNERPLQISSSVQKAIISALPTAHHYPDNNGFELKQALVQHLSSAEQKISTEQLILGNGSGNILELAARICLCSPADEVIFSQYAFALYALITQSLGASAVCVPSQNYEHNLDKMLGSITNKTKIIYIANPNNPTGTFLADDKIWHFLKQVPRHILVVLDEAYVEYVQDYSTLGFLAEFDNLLITRTFSKAYGLASLRVGYGMANCTIIDYLNRIRAPFNVNTIALVAAIAALKDKASLQTAIRLNNQGLAQLTKGFNQLNLDYIPSWGNFISVRVVKPFLLYEYLLTQGFIARPIEIPDFIRFSVGTYQQNSQLLAVLKRYYD